ncbi:MAG: MFS transporter [Candidimonas sp.]|nr:MAG: MFS transporter [Candidimonas sp.]
MFGLCFVCMLVAIDQTVVGTALPTIVAELNGFELYAWVATSYLLTSVITIPVFGRLGDYYGRKPFVIASVLVFTFASVLCGMAASMMQLVLARALQGVGGGMLVGTAFACIPDLFPDSRVRLRWQVLLSAAFGIANAVGPSLGGFLTQYAGWRSVFYVNVPIALLSLPFIWLYLPRIRQMKTTGIRLDWQGALLVALGLGSLQLFVEFLPRHGLGYWMLMLAALSLCAFVGLIYWERRSPEPLLPLDMMRNKSLVALFVLSLLSGFALFAILFYVPLLMQGGFGLSPQAAGMLITPLVVCTTVGSILNSRVIPRLSNPNVMIYWGYVLLIGCCVGMAFTRQSTSDWLLALYMMAGGLGFGFVLPNLTVYTQELAGRSLLGIATAMVQSVRMIGGMIGMAIVGTLVTHWYISGVTAVVSTAPAGSWRAILEDPQVLVNVEVQGRFIAELRAMGLDGASFLEAARVALVDAVHSGLLATLAVAVLALLWVRKVPAIKFTRVADVDRPGRK